MYYNTIRLSAIFLFIIVFLTSTSFAQEDNDIINLTIDAEKHFLKGEYREAIEIYDDILETFPLDTKIREMKAISLNNMRLQTTLASQPGSHTLTSYDPHFLNEKSMLEFYRILEIDPNNVVSLNGLGLGFGNFGEYDEAIKYLILIIMCLKIILTT